LARLLAIDFGQKRTGIAVSDPLQIIATALTTVHSKDIFDFLEEYLKNEAVEKIIVGDPKTLKNEDAQAMQFVKPFVKKLRDKFPTTEIVMFDERFTSKMAFQAMIDGGVKQKDRRDKALIDRTSAVILLQSFMETIKK
jgi:putative Holliday junction resolvase